MSKSRQSKIRHCIKAGRYFEALGRALEMIQRAAETSSRKGSAEKLLARLRDDARFLQENFSVIKKMTLHQNRSQQE